MIGHLVGAAGIAVGARRRSGAIRDQVIPPTANLHTPDPECDLDYVPLTARKAKVDTVAVNGFGFGGQNAVAIFRRSLTARQRRRRPASRSSRPRRGRSTVHTIRYVPGADAMNRIRCVWPGRALASMFARPSTAQSWKTGSSFVKSEDDERGRPGTSTSAGLKRTSLRRDVERRPRRRRSPGRPP